MFDDRVFVGRRVLVTGASGFIGSHLCRRLLRLGAEVHALSRKVQPETGDGLRWRRADGCDFQEMMLLFKDIKPEFVFHLAGHVMGSPAFEHVLPTFHANLQATVNLLTAAAETGCRRIVLTGSLNEPEIAQGETFPSSPYAASKWAGTGYARMFHALYGLPVVIARVFMVYGPDQKDLGKLIPYVTLSLLREQAPRLSSGAREIDWIYVDDVVEGYLMLAQAPGLEGATVELGSGVLVTIREIGERLEKIVGARAKIIFGALADRPMEPHRIARVAETYERLGWKPRTSLDEGLKKTVDWFRGKVQALDQGLA
jgi:UDP-glucose 4-epimerase